MEKIEDENKIKEQLLSRLRGEFPNLHFEATTLITVGYDYNILILDDRLIVRFVKTEDGNERFKTEINFLHEFGPISNVKVPDYQWVSSDGSFGGYEMIGGKELTGEAYRELEPEQHQAFVDDMATFLTRLHTFPSDQVESLGISAYNHEKVLQYATEWYRNKFLPRVGPTLGLDERDFVDSFMTGFGQSEETFQPVLCHYDLSLNHVLMGADGKVSGIIDFGDVRMGDPAKDFVAFASLGDDTQKQIYEKYKDPKDPDFLKRCRELKTYDFLHHLYRVEKTDDEETKISARKKLDKMMSVTEAV